MEGQEKGGSGGVVVVGMFTLKACFPSALTR